jgi:hypothetical protein
LSPLGLSDGRFSVPFKASTKAWSNPFVMHVTEYRKCKLATTWKIGPIESVSDQSSPQVYSFHDA